MFIYLYFQKSQKSHCYNYGSYISASVSCHRNSMAAMAHRGGRPPSASCSTVPWAHSEIEASNGHHYYLLYREGDLPIKLIGAGKRVGVGVWVGFTKGVHALSSGQHLACVVTICNVRERESLRD